MNKYEFFKRAKELDIDLKGLPYGPHGYVKNYKVYPDKVSVTLLDGTNLYRLPDKVEINEKGVIRNIFEHLKLE